MHTKKKASKRAKTARSGKAPQDTFPVDRTPALQALAADVRKYLTKIQKTGLKPKRATGDYKIPEFIDCHLERLCEFFLDRTKLVEEGIVGSRNQFIFLLCFIINPRVFITVLNRVITNFDQKHAVWKVLCCSENISFLDKQGKLITKKGEKATAREISNYIATHFNEKIGLKAIRTFRQRFKKKRQEVLKFYPAYEVVAGVQEYTIASMRKCLGLDCSK